MDGIKTPCDLTEIENVTGVSNPSLPHTVKTDVTVATLAASLPTNFLCAHVLYCTFEIRKPLSTHKFKMIKYMIFLLKNLHLIKKFYCPKIMIVRIIIWNNFKLYKICKMFKHNFIYATTTFNL